MTATLSVAIGKAVFGLPLDINPLTLSVTLVLFISSMWGFSMLLGSVGVAIRNANQLSNLIFPMMQLLVRHDVPDRADAAVDPVAGPLPAVRVRHAGAGRLGHQGASLSDVAGQLLPLAGFAVVLPAVGHRGLPSRGASYPGQRRPELV